MSFPPEVCTHPQAGSPADDSPSQEVHLPGKMRSAGIPGLNTRTGVVQCRRGATKVKHKQKKKHENSDNNLQPLYRDTALKTGSSE